MSGEVLTKRCTKCGEEKPVSEFRAEKLGKFGVRGTCKACDSNREKQYARDNPQSVQRKIARVKERRQTDAAFAERVRQYDKERYWSEDGRVRKREAARAPSRREYHRTHNNWKYENDPEFRMRQLLRQALKWKDDPQYRQNRLEYARLWRQLRRENEEFEVFMLRMEREALELELQQTE